MGGLAWKAVPFLTPLIAYTLLHHISDWRVRVRVSSCLQLNASKTEVVWCSSGRRAPNFLPNRSSSAPTWSSQYNLSSNLGIWLDSDCSMTTHINKTTRFCYASHGNSQQPFRSNLKYGSFSLHLLSYQRLITAIQLWSVYLPTALSIFSVLSTQLLKS